LAGIYIHIPFCKQACTYCNFHFSTSLTQKGDLLTALNKEINLTAASIVNSEEIATIYFGGGTPSLLSIPEIEEILSTIKSHFTISPGAEISLETNPDDINPGIVEGWRNAGVNRLSLGIQSFSEHELNWMNRAHNAEQALKSIDVVLEGGFQNISVDLIYGSPLLTNEAFVNNVNTILDKKIPHVSAYALTVEPKTALHKMISVQKSPPIDENRQAEQFEILQSMLEEADFEQYEISNFARPGFRSRHNNSYWLGEPYHGFGPAAHSYDGKNIRRWNIANNALYIKSIGQGVIPFEEEKLTLIQQLNESIMISLRTIDGLDLEKIKTQFGGNYEKIIVANSQKFISDNKLIHSEGNLVLSKEGKFFADGIAAALFF
jgi:oxygen-independent coproporphyrinogen-3 oxidase